MVKKPKFKNFELTLIDGSKVMVKSPTKQVNRRICRFISVPLGKRIENKCNFSERS